MLGRTILFSCLLALAGCNEFKLKTDDGKKTYTSGDVVTVYAERDGARVDETTLSPGWIEWSTLGVGYLGTGPELMTSQLPPGRHWIEAKVMSPSGKVLQRGGIQLTIEQQAPRPEILSIRFVPGDMLLLAGTASDFEDGAIPPSKMVWYVDDKKVGRGERLTVYGVGPGKHSVRLEATDSKRMRTGVMELVEAPAATGAAPPVAAASTPAGNAAPGGGASTPGILGALSGQ